MHTIKIYENKTGTSSSSPYLASYISKQTLRLDDFIEDIAREAGLATIQARAILSGAFEAISELENEALTRVHLPGLTIYGKITGTVDTADAPCDPEINKLQLAFSSDEETRYALANIVPAISSGADVTKVRIDNVMDTDTPRPAQVIHGKRRFRVTGVNLVLNDVGAAVYLEDKHNVTYPLTIDQQVSKQVFVAHTPTLLAAGDYKLVVKSRGGDATGGLQTASRRVKYLAEETFELTNCASIKEGQQEVPGTIYSGENIVINGMKLDWGATSTLEITDSMVTWTVTGPQVDASADGRKLTIPLAVLEDFDPVDGQDLYFTYRGEEVDGIFNETVRT